MSRTLLSGASGLVGTALSAALQKQGDEVHRLVRREPRNPNEIRWNPMQAIPPQLVSGFDAVIHLSGESVVGRWSEAKKRAIRDSRVTTSRNLAAALARAEKPPRAFLCASAIGYYGNRGDEILTEESHAGSGFLAEVSSEWEAATSPAVQAGIRVVSLRIGVVLSRRGGALKQMLLPFRLGLGGRIGSGRQWLSWIHIDDLVAAALYILQRADLKSAVNMVGPTPVTNAQFTQTLAKVLRRPAFFPVPVTAVKLAFGEFAEEGLLSSARVVPKALMGSGFVFQHPELHAALSNLLTQAAGTMSS